MGKKYIIELEDNQMAYATTIIDGVPYIKLLQTLPYTAPDLEQVQKEAYDKGYMAAYVKSHMETRGSYQQGLNDAWEAARKIWQSDSYLRIFKVPMRMYCFTKFSASEAIEKIRQYEQEQEEELGIHGYFKNGEELIDADGTKAVILRVSEDNYCQVYTENGCIENWHIHTYKFHKTGRTFPEIASVLEKMREERDG